MTIVGVTPSKHVFCEAVEVIILEGSVSLVWFTQPSHKYSAFQTLQE